MPGEWMLLPPVGTSFLPASCDLAHWWLGPCAGTLLLPGSRFIKNCPLFLYRDFVFQIIFTQTWRGFHPLYISLVCPLPITSVLVQALLQELLSVSPRDLLTQLRLGWVSLSHKCANGLLLLPSGKSKMLTQCLGLLWLGLCLPYQPLFVLADFSQSMLQLARPNCPCVSDVLVLLWKETHEDPSPVALIYQTLTEHCIFWEISPFAQGGRCLYSVTRECLSHTSPSVVLHCLVPIPWHGVG